MRVHKSICRLQAAPGPASGSQIGSSRRAAASRRNSNRPLAHRREIFQGGQVFVRLSAGDDQPIAEGVEVGEFVILDRAANHEYVAAAVQGELNETRVRRNAESRPVQVMNLFEN